MDKEQDEDTIKTSTRNLNLNQQTMGSHTGSTDISGVQDKEKHTSPHLQVPPRKRCALFSTKRVTKINANASGSECSDATGEINHLINPPLTPPDLKKKRNSTKKP